MIFGIIYFGNSAVKIAYINLFRNPVIFGIEKKLSKIDIKRFGLFSLKINN